MTDEEKRSEEAEATAETADAVETQGSGESAGDESATDASGSSGAEGSGESNSSSEDSGSHGSDAAPAVAEPEESAVDTEPAHQVAAAAAAHGDHGHGHDGHGHDGHGHDDHLGHTAPMSLLIGVLIALSLLTILTVAVTAVDLGGQGNFIVAMVIATVKAVLVMGYFMHMFWDSKFNVLAFTSSFLFVLLFLGMTLLDRAEYRPNVDKFENDQKALAR